MKKKILMLSVCMCFAFSGCNHQRESISETGTVTEAMTEMSTDGLTEAGEELFGASDNDETEAAILTELEQIFTAAGSVWLDSFAAAKTGEPVMESEFCGSYNSYFTYITGSAIWNGDLTPVWAEYAPTGNQRAINPDGQGMTVVTLAESPTGEADGSLLTIKRESADDFLSDYEEEIQYEHGQGGFLIYEGEYYYLHEMRDEFSDLLIGAYLVRFFEDGYYEEMEIKYEGADYHQEILSEVTGYETVNKVLLDTVAEDFLVLREAEWNLAKSDTGVAYAYQEWPQALLEEEYTLRLVRAGLDYLLQTGIYEDDSFMETSLVFIDSEKKLMMRLGRVTGWSEQIEFLG